MIVDDYNFIDVRRGTEEALKVLPARVVYERTVFTTRNPDGFNNSLFHNGMKVFVLEKSNLL